MATRNEEKAIGKVITEIQDTMQDDVEIVVVDGSVDETPKIARQLGARVISQSPKGYGIAVKRAVLEGTGDIIITLDADDTYPVENIPRLVEILRDGYAIASASRMQGIPPNMRLLNVLGNKILALLVTLLSLRRVHDVTTGMRAYRREIIHWFDWTENTGLSAELLIRPLIHGYKVKEIDIRYDARLGETKLDPFKGFLSILKTVVKYCLFHRRKR
ncbi:glycosyltransferase [Candidatus Bathyarchaeota archaeon]|nr:glycosyltransferase [Candidatus Bathyarchaeota archaeon]